MCDDIQTANAQLISIFAKKIEMIDEDYLGSCAKTVKVLSEKSVRNLEITLSLAFDRAKC